MVLWKTLNSRAAMTEGDDKTRLPGKSGRRLIFVPDFGPRRFMHFSWRAEAFCLRDFIGKREARNQPGLSALDVWSKHQGPVLKAERVPVDDVDFWTNRLTEITREFIEKPDLPGGINGPKQ